MEKYRSVQKESKNGYDHVRKVGKIQAKTHNGCIIICYPCIYWDKQKHSHLRRQHKMKLYLLALLISLQFTLVCSWGADGHQIVAQVASAFLTPTTWSSINPLLGGNTLANISVWPDAYDHSTEGSWSEKYHFVNLQTGALNFTYAACFPPEAPSSGCVVTGIQNITGLSKTFTLLFTRLYLFPLCRAITNGAEGKSKCSVQCKHSRTLPSFFPCSLPWRYSPTASCK